MKSSSSIRLPFVSLQLQDNLQSNCRQGAVLLACVIGLMAAGCGGGSGGSRTPPSNLGYPNIKATVGVAISPDTPYFTGTITTFSVSPALPAGFSINAASGVISGTPTAGLATTQYTVTASNSIGSDTATLLITVNPIPPTDLNYPQQAIGASVGTAMPYQ